MSLYKNKEILVTGGTGSFGNQFCKKIAESKIKPKKLIIYSRDDFSLVMSETRKDFVEQWKILIL